MSEDKFSFTAQVQPQTADLTNLVTQICNLKSQEKRLLEKFTVRHLLLSIDNQKISQIQQQVFSQDTGVPASRQKVDLMVFIKEMLKVIIHSEIETLYVVISLVDFFKAIQEAYELEDRIMLKDLTNFVCDYQSLLKQQDGYIIKSKQLLIQRQISPVVERIRLIDKEPPELLGETPEGLSRLMNNKIWTDNQHHHNHRIKKYAVFVEEKNQIVTLDSLSQKLDIFDQACTKLGSIYPSKDDDKDFIILDFAYSRRQSRLGACLMDMSLSFWECADNFRYCKNFQINSQTQQYQTKIWYLEHFTAWITTDDTHRLYEWDLQSERIKRTIPKYSGQILDIVEADYLQIILIATVDRFIHLQNFVTLNRLQKIDVTEGGIHSLKFSNQFQTILVAGYCNHVKLYSLHNECYDPSYEGALVGHIAMISGLQIMKHSPMVVTCDDSGILKVWDIRALTAIQTLLIGSNTIMHTLIDMSAIGRLALVGIRLYVIKFETIQKDIVAEDKCYALNIDYNFQTNELLVATRKDVRFYSMRTGRLIKVLKNLTKEPEEEITAFKMIRANKSFLIGNQRGIVSAHNFIGEALEQQDSMTNEISNCKLDTINKLFVVSSECNLSIQSLERVKVADYLKFTNKPHTLREIKNLHSQKVIICLELSVYHNLIFSGSNTQTILAFDYEFGKLLGSITLPIDTEPTNIQCVNGYSLLLVGTSSGHMICFHFHLKDSGLKFRMMIVADLNQIVSDHFSALDETPPKRSFIQKFLCDITGGEAQPQQNLPSSMQEQKMHLQQVKSDKNYLREIRSFLLYLALASGSILILDITYESVAIVSRYVTYQAPAYSRLNYNPQRVSSEDVRAAEVKSISEGVVYDLQAMEVVEVPLDYTDETLLIQQRRASVTAFTQPDSMLFQHVTRRIIHLDKNHVVSYFKAHGDVITSMTTLELDTLYLITASNDSYVKIWDIGGYQLIMERQLKPNLYDNSPRHDGLQSPTAKVHRSKKQLEQLRFKYKNTAQPKPACSFNLNHPLPLLWDLRDKHQQKEQRKVLFAMRIVDIMFRKYKDDIQPAEEKLLSLQPLFAYLAQSPQTTLNVIKQSEDIVLMQDEFSPNDLNIKKAKHLFLNELQGPHLKQLDKLKRLQTMAESHAISQPAERTKIENKLQEINDMCNLERKKDPFKEEERHIYQFLVDPDYKKHLLGENHQISKPKEELFKRTFTQKLQDQICPAAKSSEKKSPVIRHKKLPSISWTIKPQEVLKVRKSIILNSEIMSKTDSSKQIASHNFVSAKSVGLIAQGTNEQISQMLQLSNLKNSSVHSFKQKPQHNVQMNNDNSQLFFSKQQSLFSDHKATNYYSGKLMKQYHSNNASLNQSKITNTNDTVNNTVINTVNNTPHHDRSMTQHKLLNEMIRCMSKKKLHYQQSMVNVSGDHFHLAHDPAVKIKSISNTKESTKFQSRDYSREDSQLEEEDQFKNDLDEIHASISDNVKNKLQHLVNQSDVVLSKTELAIKLQSIQDPQFVDNVMKYSEAKKRRTRKAKVPLFVTQQQI